LSLLRVLLLEMGCRVDRGVWFDGGDWGAGAGAGGEAGPGVVLSREAARAGSIVG
jgi:hypothetical protein